LADRSNLQETKEKSIKVRRRRVKLPRFFLLKQKQNSMEDIKTSLELLSLKEAAELTPYSADYLNLLARKGKIRARKIGRDWLITKSDLFHYLRKQHIESQSRLRQLSKYLNLLM
jgi:excisionase family DNA binding protein